MVAIHFKKTLLSLHCLAALSAGWTTSAYAVYDEHTQTETLLNGTVSRTRHVGEFYNSYDHTDRDLLIKWTEVQGRSDGAAIRDGSVNVRNLTIDSQFWGPTHDDVYKDGNKYYTKRSYDGITNKGVYASDGLSHLQASGDINITARDDGVYTETNGSVLIDGFKNLTIKGTGYGTFAAWSGNLPPEDTPAMFTKEAHQGIYEGRSVHVEETHDLINTEGSYGLVDNGKGIVVRGGEGSTVDITSNSLVLAAIGNSLRGSSMFGADLGPQGTGITVSADTVNVKTYGIGISAGTGKDGNRFDVVVDAENLSVSSKDGLWKTALVAAGNAQILLNQQRQGKVEIFGRVNAGNNGTIRVNLDGDGSNIQRQGDGEALISAGGLPDIYNNVVAKGTIELNFRGNDQFIKGLAQSDGEDSTLTLRSTGDRFSAQAYNLTPRISSDTTRDAAFAARHKGLTEIILTGNDDNIQGQWVTERQGKLHLNASGDRLTLKGNWALKKQDLSTAEEPGAELIAHLSGKDVTVIGDFSNNTDASLSVLDFSGDNATYQGKVALRGKYGSYGSGNENINYYYAHGQSQMTFNMSGANSKHTGSLTVQGENHLTASYTGGNGVLHYAGSRPDTVLEAAGGQLDFTMVRGTVTGNMLTNLYKVETGRKRGSTPLSDYTTRNVKGTLNATLDASTWTGDVKNAAGNTRITLQNASEWKGNLNAVGHEEDDHLAVTLNRSRWTGHAEGTGEVTLEDRSLWLLDANSELKTLAFSDGWVSLEGEAQHLTTQALNGAGGFLLDVKYQDNNVATYRDGDQSDYLVAQTGDGGTHRVAISGASDLSTLTAGKKLYFATVGAGTATFKADVERVYIPNPTGLYDQIYRYRVDKEADVPAVTPPAEETPAADTPEEAVQPAANTVLRRAPLLRAANTAEATNNADAETEETAESNTSASPALENWYFTLDGVDNVPNSNSKTPATLQQATLALWRDNDTLLKRLGELRYGEEEEGAWVRVISHRHKANSLDFSGRYETVQVGLDHERLGDDRVNPWYFGAAYAYTHGKPELTTGIGRITMHDLTLYATNIRESGAYTDWVARVGRITSSYESLYHDQARFSTWAGSVGLETGWKKRSENGWSIEPQAQLTYHVVAGDKTVSSEGIRIEQERAKSLVGRLGVVVAKENKTDTEKPWRVYAKASVLHDFLGKTATRLDTDYFGVRHEGDLSDTWFVVGVGTNVQLGKTWQLYLDAETALAAKVKSTVNLEAGVRYRF